MSVWLGKVRAATVREHADDAGKAVIEVHGENGKMAFAVDETQAFAFDDLAEEARRTIYHQLEQEDDDE